MSEITPPHDGHEDDLVLSLWQGDENAKAQLVARYSPALERSIAGRFRRLHSGEVEDVVCDAIARLWEKRDMLDPARVPLRVCLYRIAYQVASEYTSGRLNWQKARLLERRRDGPLPDREVPDDVEVTLDQLEIEKPALLKAVAAEFAKLNPVEQDVMTAFADAAASEYDLDASKLGIEMGEKYQGGVPYTGVNIRQIKFRAKQKLTAALKARGFDEKSLGCAS